MGLKLPAEVAPGSCSRRAVTSVSKSECNEAPSHLITAQPWSVSDTFQSHPTAAQKGSSTSQRSSWDVVR